MKRLDIPEYQIPYVISVFRKLNVTEYDIKQEGNKTIVEADVSNRMEQKIKRNLWAAAKTGQTGIRHLTREDVNSSLTGVIPKSESYYFEKEQL